MSDRRRTSWRVWAFILAALVVVLVPVVRLLTRPSDARPALVYTTRLYPADGPAIRTAYAWYGDRGMIEWTVAQIRQGGWAGTAPLDAPVRIDPNHGRRAMALTVGPMPRNPADGRMSGWTFPGWAAVAVEFADGRRWAGAVPLPGDRSTPLVIVLSDDGWLR